MRFALLLCSLTLGLGGLLAPLSRAAQKDAGEAFDDMESTNSEHQSIGDIDFLPRIEQVFSTALDKGAVSGSSFINQSLDSLMESVFYSLLDNEASIKLGKFLSFNGNLSRQLFTTGAGNYIVVENFSMGPEFFSTFAHLKHVPVGFGANASVGILNIYPRSDAQRTIEEITFPTWKYWVSNWFGLLPALERVLPPSFNPNEMYNPIEQLKTPFVFPFGKSTFEDMDIGAIRSYTFKGGVHLPFGLEHIRNIDYQNIFKEFDLVFNIPYTLFVQGEYRITVLKKANQKAWVGLTRTKNVGHSLVGVVGTTFMLLENALGPIPFAGIPAKLQPIDVNATGAILDTYDLVYEFDLNHPEGRRQYEKAVLGDFTLPRQSQPENGTLFHFQKDAVSDIKTTSNAKNFVLVYAIGHSQSAKDSKIRVRDGQREYYVLESAFHHNDSEVNILVGENERTITGDMLLNVNKVPLAQSDSKNPSFEYEFTKDLPPYELILQLQINDKSANFFNYQDYMDYARAFTQQELSDVPPIPAISQAQLAYRRQRTLFFSPSEVPLDVRVTNTVVGKLSAVAIVALSAEHITAILESTPEEKHAAFSAAFGRSSRGITNAHLGEWLLSSLAYPLRLVNTTFVSVDAPLAIQAHVKALSKVNARSKPVEILQAFSEILDTDYPLETIRGLYNLVDMSNVPRKVTFYIDPEKTLDKDLKIKIEHLNNKTYKSGTKFPGIAPFRRAEYKLAAFNPQSVGKTFEGSTKITKAELKDNKVVEITVESPHASLDHIQLYFKLATTAQLQLGELVLGKKVVILPTKKVHDKDHYVFELPLAEAEFTPLEVLKRLRLAGETGFSDGKQYVLTLSISQDRIQWSKTRQVYFTYDKGIFSQDLE